MNMMKKKKLNKKDLADAVVKLTKAFMFCSWDSLNKKVEVKIQLSKGKFSSVTHK